MGRYKLAKVAVLGLSMSLITGCNDTNKSEVANTSQPVIEEPGATVYSGDIKKDIDYCSLSTGSSVYENLKVTGKKLGDLDIYMDRLEEKFVIIAGEELMYLPIDKDGVVKLKDGVYNYWQELRCVPMTVLVGKVAKEYPKSDENLECGISYRGFVNPDISCWLSEDGTTKNVDLKSLCEGIGLKYETTSGGAIISACRDKFSIEMHQDAVLRLGQIIECEDFEYVGDGNFVVGEEYLQKVLGMDTSNDGNVLNIDGTLVPQLVLLDKNTATDAVNHPFGLKKENNALTLKHIFGEYTQDKEINPGIAYLLHMR